MPPPPHNSLIINYLNKNKTIMKTLLILLSIMTILPVIGMFYWMYKSKNGSLKLNSKSWHFKLLNWMWETEIYGAQNACPYYWSIILSIYFLPFYLIIKYLVIGIVEIIDYFKGVDLSWLKLPEIKFLDNIPTSKKEMYIEIYSRGKTILSIMLIVALIIIITYCLIKLFNVNRSGTLIGILILFGFTMILVNYDRVLNTVLYIFKPIWGVLTYPFRIIGKYLTKGINKLLGIYTEHCPPIDWE